MTKGVVVVGTGNEGFARLSIRGMNMMPVVKYREDWVKADYDRRVTERLDGLRVGSQGDQAC